MERWGKEQPQRGHENPSFSSTLLDAIYRSMDEPDAGRAPDRSATAAPRRPAVAYYSAAPVSDRAVTRHRSLRPISTSSSSDNSSYGGFSSSSEPESAARNRARIRPIRTDGGALARSAARPAPPPLPPQRVPSPPKAHHREKTKSSSIRSKLRDLGRSKAPASPGARLAGLLNSLFSAAAKNPKKSKTSAAAAADDSTCSTASSHSRSCLVKTPSTRRAPQSEDEGVKRSVRFHPVSVIVGEDLRPCGQKSVYEGDREGEGRRRSVASAAEGKGREETRRRVEELLRGFEEDDDMSDSSSDLFELENLTMMGKGGGYRDELPVYETTHPGTNRAISRGLVL